PSRRQVRQLPQLFEGLEGQVLRLINDERHIPARVGLVQEALLHLGPQLSGIVCRHWHIETAGHQGEDLPEREARLPKEHRSDLRRRDAGQIGVHQRRFPYATRARDDHQALAGGNPMRQSVQSHLMTRTHKQQSRIRSEGERRTFEMVKVEIHTYTIAPQNALPRSRQTEGLRERQHALGFPEQAYSNQAHTLPERWSRNACRPEHRRLSMEGRVLQGFRCAAVRCEALYRITTSPTSPYAPRPPPAAHAEGLTSSWHFQIHQGWEARLSWARSHVY